jgi:hypothetical protein
MERLMYLVRCAINKSPKGSVVVLTSPPWGILVDYGHDLGFKKTEIAVRCV